VSAAEPRQRTAVLDLKTRSGGVYIPPFKMKQLLAESGALDDTSGASESFQRLQWDALRKSINGLINKANVANIRNIVEELFQENLIRGKGLFARAIMKAQMASPSFTHVYSALLAVVNTKLPEIGELVVKRAVRQFLRSFRRNDRIQCISTTTLLAHLVNQQVAHEIVALELVYLLLEKPTDDSVEIAVNFVKSVGALLLDLIPKGMATIMERFRAILQEGEIDTRVQYVIEGLFVVRRNNFKDYPTIIPELDLVENEDQIPHEISLNDDHDAENGLDVFKFDPDWQEHEDQYAEIRKEILGDEDAEDEEEVEEEQNEDEAEQPIVDDKEKAIVDAFDEEEKQAQDVIFRKQVYLTVMSSANFEECTHKLLKVLVEGKERVMAEMIVECCAQERVYQKFYGLIGERLCRLHRKWLEIFDELFADMYATIHRLDTNKIRNVAKFFAHLLFTGALEWSLFEYIIITEEETTSSSRIFLKVLFQELSEYMTLDKLRERLYDPEYQVYFQGIFPNGSAKELRFSINFFTSIGLGGVT
jgi:pre-mRNA-splicing factor CWC22